MIELAEHVENLRVQPAEYRRLLGYPPHVEFSARALELEKWAGDWFARHGRPWLYARLASDVHVENGGVQIEGTQLCCQRLQLGLTQSSSDCVALVAVSAGPEIEQAAQRAWREGKPDEYFFLEVLGSAVVEHLTTLVGARLCDWADKHGRAVLPHYSPGYVDWDVAEQPKLLALVQQPRSKAMPERLGVLDSGMLRPKKSLLAVFGLTRQLDGIRRVTDLIPCESCSFQPCQYRRREYVPPAMAAFDLPVVRRIDNPEVPSPNAFPLQREARYSVNAKALRRWTKERLTLKSRADGSVDALFRYEGTTCTNLGRALQFEYHISLGTRRDHYPIRAQRCIPASDDTGHTSMCRYLSNPDELMNAIETEKPLHGSRLDEVLSWDQPSSNAGCYCELADRMHKWRIVLETIHFALVERDLEFDHLGKTEQILEAT